MAAARDLFTASLMRLVALLCTAALTCAAPLCAQGGMIHTPGMTHTPGMEHGAARTAMPTLAGQYAFATVSEIVKLLEADSTTDWSRVDLEALRQHLIDMDLVTMRARVQQAPVAGGLVMTITGDAPVAAAITRMVTAHAPMLQAAGPWRASTARVANGVRFTVIAADASDARAIARIRGLGFIGLMVQGDHHVRHHLMSAKGAGAHAHEM